MTKTNAELAAKVSSLGVKQEKLLTESENFQNASRSMLQSPKMESIGHTFMNNNPKTL